LHEIVNPLRLGGEFGVERAGDDTSMVGYFVVQANEMLTVQRQYGATFGLRESENVRVSHRLTPLSGFLNRQNVVTQAPQFDDNRQPEILISV